jgi:2-polyprenyl-3-methyl-5-hydroxy-6-metoxy-1,4-benzoquinol methylase
VSDATRNPNDPRWGQEERDAKAEAILKTLQIHTGQKLTDAVWLDIGCGSGGIAATLAAHVKQVIGVDPEDWERWCTFRHTYPNLVFHKGSYCDLDRLLGSESIDVVVCNQVYEHVDDPVALLRAIHAVLKPGGLCYFAGPNLLWPIEPHVSWPFVHWLPRGFAVRLMTICRARYARFLDAWSWSYWRLARAFDQFGFRHEVAMRERLQVESAQRRSMVLHVLAWLPTIVFFVFAPFSPGFIFVLQKRDEAGT